MKSKSLAILLVMMMAIGGVAFAQKTTITFQSVLSGSDGGYMDQIIQKFNKANPDIEVSHLVVGDSVEYKQKLSTGLASKTAPQVVMMRKFDTPLYLDSFKGFTAAEWKALGIDTTDIYPNLLDGLSKSGKILGIPLDVWVFYMAYNKANFKKAGLDPEKPPTNQAEFVKAMVALKKVTPEGITPYYENFTWAWIWVHMLWQFGGDLLTPDFKKPAFKDAGVKTCKFLLDLEGQGIIPKAAVDAGPAFQSGQGSVLITGIWTINPWKDALGADFGYAVAPQLGTTKATFGGSHILAFPSVMVQDKKTMDAAAKWVRYLWDNAIDWYAAGQTPSRKSIAQGTELKKRLPHIWAVSQQQQFVKSFQQFPLISECLQEIAVNLEDVLITQKQTPEAAMAKATDSVQLILDDYWASH